jgi:hypothetical protein
VVDLANEFAEKGWNLEKGPLIGYPGFEGNVQLLSGSHRYEAAKMAGLDIPVQLYSRQEIYDAYGDLSRWREIMEGR